MIAITIEHTKNPAPYKAPILYDTPSAVPEATIAVITSPAPFAKANKVTAANASESFNQSLLIKVILGPIYSSTVN